MPERELDLSKSFNHPASLGQGSTIKWHPVFAFLVHQRGNDNYDAAVNPLGARGDVLVVPGYSESGAIGYFSMSFHKGETHTAFHIFDGANHPGEHTAAHNLLIAKETR